jgi:hypothetical protein
MQRRVCACVDMELPLQPTKCPSRAERIISPSCLEIWKSFEECESEGPESGDLNVEGIQVENTDQTRLLRVSRGMKPTREHLSHHQVQRNRDEYLHRHNTDTIARFTKVAGFVVQRSG